jgi:hypothetical protein
LTYFKILAQRSSGGTEKTAESRSIQSALRPVLEHGIPECKSEALPLEPSSVFLFCSLNISGLELISNTGTTLQALPNESSLLYELLISSSPDVADCINDFHFC